MSATSKRLPPSTSVIASAPLAVWFVLIRPKIRAGGWILAVWVVVLAIVALLRAVPAVSAHHGGDSLWAAAMATASAGRTSSLQPKVGQSAPSSVGALMAQGVGLVR